MTAALTDGGSAVCRWQLGLRLKALRERAGKTPADVTAAHLGSGAKISRTEAGHHAVRVSDVRAWCSLYGASVEVTEELVLLAVGSQQRDWHEAAGVPDWFKLYMGLERTAASVLWFEPWLVAGLVQTENYARALLSRQPPTRVVEKRVRFRMARQKAARNVITVIGESALHVAVGGPEVLAEQVEHLRTTNTAQVRILPYSVGEPPSVHPFSLLEFRRNDPRCVYVETDVGRYSGQASDWETYRATWDSLIAGSVPIGEWSR